MAVKHTLRDFLEDRLWALDFIFKFLAWGMNIFSQYALDTAIISKNIPVYNSHQNAFYYFTIPAYNIILTSLIILYFLGEVPDFKTQRVLIVLGFSLFIITGTIGLCNCMTNRFENSMLVMSLVLIANGMVLIFDFVQVEDFFKEKNKKKEQTDEDEEEEEEDDDELEEKYRREGAGEV